MPLQAPHIQVFDSLNHWRLTAELPEPEVAKRAFILRSQAHIDPERQRERQVAIAQLIVWMQNNQHRDQRSFSRDIRTAIFICFFDVAENHGYAQHYVNGDIAQLLIPPTSLWHPTIQWSNRIDVYHQVH